MANITKRFFGKSWQEIGVEIERDRLKEQEEKRKEEEAEKEAQRAQRDIEKHACFSLGIKQFSS